MRSIFMTRYSFTAVLNLVLAALLLILMGIKTTHAAEIRVSYPGAGIDSTAAIQQALNDSKYTRVILEYQPDGWITEPLFMNAPSQELWLAGNGQKSNRLIAKAGGFVGSNDCMIRVQAPGCKINGYNNGVDATAGRAIIEMRKADYVKAPYNKGEWRHGIHSSQSNLTIQGVEVRNAGGDGIYINGGYSVQVKDVVCDAAHRNGMSIIKVNGLTINDSVFKNTKGTSPEAGIDFEPNFGTEEIVNVKVNRCTFADNNIRQVLVTIHQLNDGGVLGINFSGCTMTGGQYGVWVAGCHPTGPMGNVFFENSTIANSSKNAIFVQKWATDRAKVTFHKGTITNCGTGESRFAPVEIQDGGVQHPVGEVHFKDAWRIDDYLQSHPYIIGGSAKAYGFKNITSAAPIVVQRHYDARETPPVNFTSDVPHVNVSIDYQSIP
jgi:hypothetical protein